MYNFTKNGNILIFVNNFVFMFRFVVSFLWEKISKNTFVRFGLLLNFNLVWMIFQLFYVFGRLMFKGVTLKSHFLCYETLEHTQET